MNDKGRSLVPFSVYFSLTSFLAFSFFVFSWVQDPASPVLSEQEARAPESLERRLSDLGVRFDLSRKLIEIDGFVCQDREPLEYLIVNEHGKKHESLFRVDGVSAEALNAAMLLCGVKKGLNVDYVPVDPPPTKEEFEQGAPTAIEIPAKGDGFYIYISWDEVRKDGDKEQYFYRAEDLVVNVNSDRAYRRGKFIYLGSRFIRPHKDASEMFAADAEGNLVSLVYFKPANHLLTGNDPDANNQYVWYPNAFLLPEIGSPVKILFSYYPIEMNRPIISR